MSIQAGRDYSPRAGMQAIGVENVTGCGMMGMMGRMMEIWPDDELRKKNE